MYKDTKYRIGITVVIGGWKCANFDVLIFVLKLCNFVTKNKIRI